MANLFRDHYIDGSRVGARLRTNQGADISRLLDELLPKPATAEKSLRTTEALPTADVRGGAAQDLLARKWHNTHHIGTLQLLALLKTKLRDEEPALTFNYFAMHRRSIELLRLIREKEHHKLCQYFAPQYMPDESMIANLVILVHHVARGSAQAGSAMGLAGSGGSEVVSRIIGSCGDVMRAYLEKNGDAGSKEVRAFCKNKKPLVESSSELECSSQAEEKFFYWISLEEVSGPMGIEALKTGISIS